MCGSCGRHRIASLERNPSVEHRIEAIRL